MRNDTNSRADRLSCCLSFHRQGKRVSTWLKLHFAFARTLQHRLVAASALLPTAFLLGLTAFAERPPAVPLIAHDPYFSVWSMADKLTDQNTKHWTGKQQPISGLARIDGKTWRFMGDDPREIPAMTQTSLQVTPTHTNYSFEAAGVTLTVSFFSPSFPKDLDVLSRPVTYLTLGATGQGDHDVSILIDVDPVIAVNNPDEAVTWGRSAPGGLTVLNAGSRDQHVLDRPGDDLASTGAISISPRLTGRRPVRFVRQCAATTSSATGSVPQSDDMDMPLDAARGRRAIWPSCCPWQA